MWDKIDKRGPDECWPWLGTLNAYGYGVIGHRRKLAMVHRLVLGSTVGGIPEGMVVLHLCDNPPCCNPAHLRVGTYRENTHDAIAKQRMHWQPLSPRKRQSPSQQPASRLAPPPDAPND